MIGQPFNPFQQQAPNGTATPPMPAMPTPDPLVQGNAPVAPQPAQGMPAQVPTPRPQPTTLGPNGPDYYTMVQGQPQQEDEADPDKLLAEMEQTENPQQQGAPSDADSMLAEMQQHEQTPAAPPASVQPGEEEGGPTAMQNLTRGIYGFGAKALDTLSTLPVFKRILPQHALHPTEAGMAGMTNYSTVHDVLSDVGEKIAAGQTPDLATAQGQLEHYGLMPDMSRFSGRLGYNMGQGIVMALAMQAAAPRMAASGGMTGLSYLMRETGRGLQAHPWGALIAEIMAYSPGSTLGSEAMQEAYKDQPPANQAVAGFTGGLIGGGLMGVGTVGAQWIVKKAAALGITLTSKAATIVANTVDNVGKRLGALGTPGTTGITGRAGPAPLVGDDQLDALRNAEMAANHAGDLYSQAATRYRELDIAHPDKTMAGQQMAKAKADEIQAQQVYDDAWNAIPPKARVGMNQSQDAIRSLWADSMRAKVFAEEQLAGDRHMVNDKMEEALSAVKPNEPGVTTEQWATKVAEGVQNAERMADNMESRLYKRANLNVPIESNTRPNSDLDAFTADVRARFADATYPTEQVRALRSVLNPDEGQPLPTLQKLRAESSEMGQAVREEYAKEAPNYSRIAHLRRLQSMVASWINSSQPDNIALTQATQFTIYKHNLFSRSEVQPFLKSNRRGGQAIAPKDTISELLKRPDALHDIYNMTTQLENHPAFKATFRIREGNWRPQGPTYQYNRLGTPQEFGPGTATQGPGGGQPYIAGEPTSAVGNYTARTGAASWEQTSNTFPPGAIDRGGVSWIDPDYNGGVRFDRLFSHTDATQLGQLRSDIENGIRSQFQDEVQAAMARTTGTGEPVPPSTAALKTKQVVDKWAPRIKDFSDVAGELQATVNDTLQIVQQRRAIEQSAFVKYVEGRDPEQAISTIWNSKDPAATARALINGSGGVGGFSKDPAALEGFRAALTDKFLKASNNNPSRILENLRELKTWRLLNAGLGGDRVDRLERLAKTLLQMEKAADGRWAELIITGAKFGALKLSAMMPKIGEGAELQQAAIFSKTAARWAKGLLHNKDSAEWLGEAVRDPAVERMLLEKTPDMRVRDYSTLSKTMNQNLRAAKRALNFGSAIISAYQGAQSRTDQDPPVDPTPSVSHYPRTGWNASDIFGISSAQAGELPKEPGAGPIPPDTLESHGKVNPLESMNPLPGFVTGAVPAGNPFSRGQGNYGNRFGENPEGRGGSPPAKIDEKKLAELHATGMSQDKIAEALGTSRSSIRRRMKYLDLEPHPTSVETGAWSKPGATERLRDLMGKGASFVQIGREMGVSPGAAHRVAERMGLQSLNQQGRPGVRASRRFGGTAEGFNIPTGPTPSMPKLNLPEGGSPEDIQAGEWLHRKMNPMEVK